MVLSLASIALSSCNTVQPIPINQITVKKGCENFNLSNGTPLIKAFLNGNERSFLLATGSPATVIYHTLSFESNGKQLDSIQESGKSINASEQLNDKNFAAHLKTALFESERQTFSLVSTKNKGCCPNVEGVIGLDCFFGNKYALFLNFTDGKICNINEIDLRNHLANKGFKAIKSQCRFNSVYIFLTIMGKEYKFLLDSGSVGHLIIPESAGVNLAHLNSMQMESTFCDPTQSITQRMDTHYEKAEVMVGKQRIPTKIIVSKTAKHQLIGVDFLKGFDWIFDYNNKKVYAKRNHIKIENTFDRKNDARAD